MKRPPRGTPDSESVLSRLEETTCVYCSGGVLLRDTFKGTDAVVCDDCGTPGARVW